MDMLTIINAGLINGELRLLAGTTSDTTNDRTQDVGRVPRATQQTEPEAENE